MTYWKYLHSNLTSYNKKCETTNNEASGVLKLKNSFYLEERIISLPSGYRN